MPRLTRPCLKCGRPFRPAGDQQGSRCPACYGQAQRDRGSAAQRGYDNPYRSNAKTIKDITWGRGLPCAICGEPFTSRSGIVADHRIPLSKGGTSDISNLQGVHKKCNERKGNRG